MAMAIAIRIRTRGVLGLISSYCALAFWQLAVAYWLLTVISGWVEKMRGLANGMVFEMLSESDDDGMLMNVSFDLWVYQ